MEAGAKNLMPIVSKIFCSASQTMLNIRKRPKLVNGGGFTVLNSHQNVIFSVYGCGVLGVNGELIIKDGYGASIVFIHKKGGLVQALSSYDKWKGYLMDFGKPSKCIFSLRDPRSCFAMSNSMRISAEHKDCDKDWDFEVKGSFLEKSCTINDRQGNIVAKVEAKEVNTSEDFYHVFVQPGYDQAFVIGVIAVLDNIHGESTSC